MTLEELLVCCRGNPIEYANLIEKRNCIEHSIKRTQQRIYDAEDSISCFDDCKTDHEKELLQKYLTKKERAEKRLANLEVELQSVINEIKYYLKDGDQS